MIFNTYSEYAIRLVFNLAERKPDRSFVRIKEIAEELGLSYYLLAKVANTLIQNKILSSNQGPKGGVKLSVSPSELTIFGIISHFSKLEDFSKCILSLDDCGNGDPCAIHSEWIKTKKPLFEIFHKPITELDGLKSLKKAGYGRLTGKD